MAQLGVNKAKGSFVIGFNLKGFNESTVGSDLISTFSTPDTWTSSGVGERYVTAPIQIDLTADRKLKDCADGEKPDGYLYRNVNGDTIETMSAKELMLYIDKDWDVAGNPTNYVKHVDGGFIQTSLLDATNTPIRGDSVYVSGALYSNVDPLAGSGVPIGTVVEDETSGQDTGYILIKLS